ncbi:MAG: hypothetical protein HY716_05640 [Planctomycetes bacterium]|nr:hypothetical protein [Planctomycetota bacterium]
MRAWIVPACLAALLGCARGARPAAAPPMGPWVCAERRAAETEAGGGDARVDAAESVLMFQTGNEAESPARPLLTVPGAAADGERFVVEVRVPHAAPGEKRRFWILPGRAGLKLLDGPRVETEGTAPVRLRARAVIGGTVSFVVEEIR